MTSGAGVPDNSRAAEVSPATIPGVVTVSARAMRSLFSALASEELGVNAREVDARVNDVRGHLAVHVAGPIRVAPLDEVRDRGIIEASGEVRARVQHDGQRLSGATIDSVRVRVTGTRIQKSRRVA